MERAAFPRTPGVQVAGEAERPEAPEQPSERIALRRQAVLGAQQLVAVSAFLVAMPPRHARPLLVIPDGIRRVSAEFQRERAVRVEAQLRHGR